MSLSAEKKLSVSAQYKRNEKDTGSPEVQIAILTASILELTEHMKQNKKDLHSRRGLLKKVSQRRRLLDYLKKTKSETYERLIASLGLRK
jgi:small subunit ribosomal protein S15